MTGETKHASTLKISTTIRYAYIFVSQKCLSIGQSQSQVPSQPQLGRVLNSSTMGVGGYLLGKIYPNFFRFF